MKAIVADRFGPPDVLRYSEVEKPIREAHEILVRIHSVSVNPLDTVLRSGIPMGAYTPTPPYIPGFGIAGVVAECSTTSRFSVGDRVWGTKHSAGGCAEYGVYKEHELEALPPQLSFNQGAIIDTPFRTAFWSLFDLGEARVGDTIVVTGAGGSVGYACVQVAQDAGLQVIAICGERDKALVSALGVEAVFDYKRPSLQSELESFLSGRFATIFVDVAATQNVGIALNVLGQGGKHIIVGPGGATPMAVDAFALIAKGIKVCGVALYESSIERRTEISQAITDGFKRGVFCVSEPIEMPLPEAKAAHELLQSGQNSGKLVLSVK